MSVTAMSLVFKTDLPPGPKLVLLALANFADDENKCWPSIQTLHKYTSIAESTIYAHLATLESRGLISRDKRERTNGSQRSNLYILELEPLESGPLEPSINNHQEEPLTETNVSVARTPHREFYTGRQEGSRKAQNREPEYEPWPEDNRPENKDPEPKKRKPSSRQLAIDFHDQAKVQFGGLTVTDVAALIGNFSRIHKAGVSFDELSACIEYFFKVPDRYMWGDIRPWQAFTYKFKEIRKDCDWTDPNYKTTVKRFTRPQGSRNLGK